MISVMAVFVVVAVCVAAVLFFVGLNMAHNREAEFDRMAGNLHRQTLARKTKSGFWTFEAPDGSLQWRRVSTR